MAGEKILIVEDNPQNLKVAMMALRPGGYDFVQAVDGEEAVKVAIEEKPDLILMDIMMPVMDGIEALRRIRGDVRLRTTPIVMLTSVTDVKAVTEAIESGANDYIAKPFSVTLNRAGGALRPRTLTHTSADLWICEGPRNAFPGPFLLSCPPDHPSWPGSYLVPMHHSSGGYQTGRGRTPHPGTSQSGLGMSCKVL